MQRSQAAQIRSGLFYVLAHRSVDWHLAVMDIRRHTANHVVSEATYSSCGAYRYSLTRRWQPGDVLNFVMLNPSVADERQNDPTVERCERRARMLGFGGVLVTNIFGWRDTDPFAMRRATAPEGPENDAVLLTHARSTGKVIAAWGIHGAHRQRGPQVAKMLTTAGITLFHLGLTKQGHPRHPLYVSYARKPVIWEAE